MSSLVAALDPRFDLVCVIALAAIYFSFTFVIQAPAVSEDGAGSGTSATSRNVIPISEGESARKALK